MGIQINRLDQVRDLFTTRDTLEDECERERIENALQRAYDMLKFELDLYWKRATYFWGFIALSLTGYFVLSDAKYDNKYELLLVVNSVGLIFSFGWHLVGRGSRYWQNNWVFRVYTLEALLKTPLQSLKRINKHKKRHLIGAYPFSTSKVHQIICLFITFIWVILYVFSIISNWQKVNVEIFTIVGLTMLAIYFLWVKTKGKENDPDISFNVDTLTDSAFKEPNKKPV
jgi:hypothetical protein